jgi:hypothetical protein
MNLKELKSKTNTMKTKDIKLKSDWKIRTKEEIKKARNSAYKLLVP